MCYYDNATAMAFKLGRWKQEETLRSYQLEVEICRQKICRAELSLGTRIWDIFREIGLRKPAVDS